MGMEAVEKAQAELEKISEKKWLLGIGKIVGALLAMILTYWQTAGFVEKKTERLDSKSEAGQSEVDKALKTIQQERTAEREALVKELATLRAQIETLSRRQRKTLLKPITKAAPVSTVKVSPAEVQQQAQEVKQALPPPPKAPDISPNLDVALQKMEQKAEKAEQKAEQQKK